MKFGQFMSRYKWSIFIKKEKKKKNYGVQISSM